MSKEISQTGDNWETARKFVENALERAENDYPKEENCSENTVLMNSLILEEINW